LYFIIIIYITQSLKTFSLYFNLKSPNSSHLPITRPSNNYNPKATPLTNNPSPLHPSPRRGKLHPSKLPYPPLRGERQLGGVRGGRGEATPLTPHPEGESCLPFGVRGRGGLWEEEG